MRGEGWRVRERRTPEPTFLEPSQKGRSGDTPEFSFIRGGVGGRHKREGSLILH